MTLRAVRCVAALVALAALAALNVARANHFILPCRDDCTYARWHLTGSLNTARQNHTATLLRNGKVLVAGGTDRNGAVLASAELYDPATRTWTVAGPMGKPRAGHFAFVLQTGAILVVGGDAPCCVSNITAEVYEPDEDTWNSVGGLGPIVGTCAAAMLQSNRVFVSCVTRAPSALSIPYKTAAWVYDPLQQVWNPTSADPIYRQAPDATSLPNGNVLVVGGTNDSDEVVIAPGAELYDPATGAWRTTGGPIELREAATKTLLPNGSVLVAGGFSWVTQGDHDSWTTYWVPLRGAVSYELDGNWRPVGDLNEARASHSATLIPDGHVLIAGGESLQMPMPGTYSAKALNSAELYDPTIAVWSYTSSLNVARTAHTATLLDDGGVLVVGGLGGDSSSGYTVLSSAEVYLPGELSRLRELRPPLRHRIPVR